jgi:alpha-L-rhamnosidase
MHILYYHFVFHVIHFLKENIFMQAQMITPREQNQPASNVLFADFGRHAFGRLQLEIDSAERQTIQVAVGEVLSNGRIEQNPGGSRIYQEQTLHIQPGRHLYWMTMTHPGYGAGTLVVEPEITPFRYAEVRGCSGEISIRQQAFFGPFRDDAADFCSSDEVLNQVWDFCKYTLKATNVFGIFIDGNRERQAYEGDAYINQLSYFCCDDHFEIARKTIERLFDWPTWPTEWALAMPLLVHDYLLYTGDMEHAREWYPALKPKLLLELAGENALISPQNLKEGVRFPGFPAGVSYRDLIDWPPGERDGYELGFYNLVPNCWHYAALERMSQLADILGKAEDAAFYRQRASLVRTAINGQMLKQGRYVDNPESSHTALHSLIFPLVFGVAPDAIRAELLRDVQSRGMACSVFAAQFLLEASYRNRLADYALSLMTADSLRSWQNMLKRGATITMEAWDDSLKPNQDWNHPWGASPVNIISRYLAGIQPLLPGFDLFLVDPQPGSLKSFTLRHPTVHGPISMQLESKDFLLEVPAGSTALFKQQKLQAGQHRLKLS